MSLGMEAALGSPPWSSETPPPSPTQEEKMPHTVPAPTSRPALHVHPAAGALSLSPGGQPKGPAHSGSSATSWSSGPEAPAAPTAPPETDEAGEAGPGPGEDQPPGQTPAPPSDTGSGGPETPLPGPHLHQPLTSQSAPTVLDEERPRLPPDPSVYPARGSPSPPDLWKTPFWIIEDFQAPCQGCRRGDDAQPPSSRSESPDGRAPEAGLRVSQQPPYYDLEPEDLASYLAIHPGPEACIRDSELMDVPDEDLEFWGQFYFAGVETARELIRQRRRPHK